MFRVNRKSIERVKRFFGCTSLDAIYYLMPDSLISEGRVTDFTIVDGTVPALAAEAQFLTGDANRPGSAVLEG